MNNFFFGEENLFEGTLFFGGGSANLKLNLAMQKLHTSFFGNFAENFIANMFLDVRQR